MFKRYLSLVLAILMVCSIAPTAYATTHNSSTDEYSEYLRCVEQGILGDDVTYAVWKRLREESHALEAALEASNEFALVYDSRQSAYSTYSMRAGDVFITNATVSSAILGHAAIAISSSNILHIAGPGETPSTISLSTWHDRYTNKNGADSWTKIYRHSNYTIASEAAGWAEDTYKDSGAGYFINKDVQDTTLTYCSKIVWQAYFYGPSTVSTDATYLSSGYILPYNLANLIGDVSLLKTYVGS